MTTFKVDFNSILQDGRVKASARRVDGPFGIGDAVVAWDQGEHLARPATVSSVEAGTGRVLLDVDWARQVPAVFWRCRINNARAM